MVRGDLRKFYGRRRASAPGARGRAFPLPRRNARSFVVDWLDRSAQPRLLEQLTATARRFEPAWISDHLCWTSVAGHNLHDLLPLVYTDEAVRHVAGRIRQVQETLERTILIENVSSYLEFKCSRLSEWEFLSAIADEADGAILLDLNNIFVNAFNHQFDAVRYIDFVPVERVVQFHLAGHSDHGTYLLDTHDHPIRPEVWRLYEHAISRFGRLPTLIEWDDNIPEFEILAATAEQARRRCDAVLAGSATLPLIDARR